MDKKIIKMYDESTPEKQKEIMILSRILNPTRIPFKHNEIFDVLLNDFEQPTPFTATTDKGQQLLDSISWKSTSNDVNNKAKELNGNTDPPNDSELKKIIDAFDKNPSAVIRGEEDVLLETAIILHIAQTYNNAAKYQQVEHVVDDKYVALNTTPEEPLKDIDMKEQSDKKAFVAKYLPAPYERKRAKQVLPLVAIDVIESTLKRKCGVTVAGGQKALRRRRRLCGVHPVRAAAGANPRHGGRAPRTRAEGEVLVPRMYFDDRDRQYPFGAYGGSGGSGGPADLGRPDLLTAPMDRTGPTTVFALCAPLRFAPADGAGASALSGSFAHVRGFDGVRSEAAYAYAASTPPAAPLSSRTERTDTPRTSPRPGRPNESSGTASCSPTRAGMASRGKRSHRSCFPVRVPASTSNLHALYSSDARRDRVLGDVWPSVFRFAREPALISDSVNSDLVNCSNNSADLQVQHWDGRVLDMERWNWNKPGFVRVETDQPRLYWWPGSNGWQETRDPSAQPSPYDAVLAFRAPSREVLASIVAEGSRVDEARREVRGADGWWHRFDNGKPVRGEGAPGQRVRRARVALGRRGMARRCSRAIASSQSWTRTATPPRAR